MRPQPFSLPLLLAGLACSWLQSPTGVAALSCHTCTLGACAYEFTMDDTSTCAQLSDAETLPLIASSAACKQTILNIFCGSLMYQSDTLLQSSCSIVRVRRLCTLKRSVPHVATGSMVQAPRGMCMQDCLDMRACVTSPS